MHKLAIAGFIVAFFAAPQDPPQMPKPVKEHEWLQQFLGEWESEGEITEPGAEPMKVKGTETARAIGGFWVMGEIKSEMMGQPFTGIITVGYDPEKKKYVGTWIDSMTSLLWKYEGSVDKDGKTLTLESIGPNMKEPGKTAKYRDATEFRSKDHRVFTSSVEMDGKWVTFMTINYRRKGR